MKCSQCQRENSPPDARFCVDCGYVTLQSCPYCCGRDDLPVRAGAPLPQCPGCGQFLAGCLECFRLHKLEARACPTARCHSKGVRPVEPFAFHAGTAGGAPLQLAAPWPSATPVPVEPGALSPSVTARFGALASRYGLLVWWKDARLHLWPAPQTGAFWPVGSPRSLDFFDTPPADGRLPAHQHLLLEHGHAYALHQNGAARVPLNAQGNAALQHLTIETLDEALAPSEDVGYEEIADFDDLTFGFPASPSASATPEQALDLKSVRWLWQTATSRWWLGIGRVGAVGGERLVGARARGDQAFFEGEWWELPRDVDSPESPQWSELLVWDDAPVLRSEDAVWREDNGAWREVFSVRDESRSLDGCMADGRALWLWGRMESRLWVQRLETGGAGAGASMPLGRGDRVFPFPIARGGRITFCVSGQLNAIVTLDIARPLDDAWRQPLPANTEVMWTTALAASDDAQWLIFATDDGDWVEWKGMPLGEQPSPPQLIERFRPLRDSYGDGRGATVAATVSGDALVLCHAGAEGARLRAFAPQV